MDADFPAAHSMDTEWFAVDRDGQVAVFITGENGSMPTEAQEVNVREVLQTLSASLPAEDLDPGQVLYETALPELARLGLHVYEDDTDWFSGPYVRTYRPERPLHVDQLPPQLREQIKAVRFDDLRFADKDVLQPCDHAEGDAWPSGYLSEDRETARPIPGQEAEFRQAMERMRREHPEVYQKYRIEGLEGA
jgi:hypothetical protein